MGAPAAAQHPSPQSLWARVRRRFSAPRLLAARRGICLSRRHELRAALRAVEPLAVERIALPGFAEPLEILHTADFNRLLDNAVYDPAQDHMPYWAEIWPSAVVLAGVVAREAGALRGRRVLELGPGVGLVAVAAMKAGAEVVVTDYDVGSLRLTALNALAQVGREPLAVRMNWHAPSREFLKVTREGFSLVLGSDLLYEQRDVRPVVTLLERIVAPGGELWLTEPGREPAQRLVKALRWRKWAEQSETVRSPRPDPNYHTFDRITVHRLRRPAEAEGAVS